MGWGTKKRFQVAPSRYLKSPEKTNAAENGHSQGGDDVRHGEGHLQYGCDHHKEVEAVEEGDEVEGETEGVHLEEHLEGEENDEEEVRRLLKLAQPIRLAEMLSCQNLKKIRENIEPGGQLKIRAQYNQMSANHGVEKDKSDDNPKHSLRLHCAAAFRPHTSGG